MEQGAGSGMTLKETIVKRFFGVTLSPLSFALSYSALCEAAQAQQPAKVRRIGYWGLSISPTNPERFDAFRQGLRQLGYTEGKDIIFEIRNADGKLDRLNELAAELVRLRVDVIVTRGTGPTRAAKAATSTIPIVMTQDPDPVGNGFVASLAKPGGNITGLSTLAPEISGKQLELLKETVPKLSRVAVFGTSRAGHALQLREIGLAAGPLSVQLQSLDVLGPKDIETAFRAASDQRAEALIVLGGGILAGQRTRIIEFAVKSRLPAIYSTPGAVDAGGLMSYGVNQIDLDRRAATYVDKILKGAKPADLPGSRRSLISLSISKLLSRLA
jgi:putative tryptophan/tyrosine transport system substrate-binding protein